MSEKLLLEMLLLHGKRGVFRRVVVGALLILESVDLKIDLLPILSGYDLHYKRCLSI